MTLDRKSKVVREHEIKAMSDRWNVSELSDVALIVVHDMIMDYPEITSRFVDTPVWQFLADCSAEFFNRRLQNR